MEYINDSRIDVSILMVTYNSEELLVRSIQPLVNMPHSEIIVIDNNSQDNTVSVLRSDYPMIRVFRNLKNDGFGKAMNIAAGMAKGDTLLLLNPDAEITEETVMQLSRRNAIQDGISAPVIHQPDGRLSIHSAGRFPTAWRMFTHFSGLSRIAFLGHAFEGHYLIPRRIEPLAIETDWVTGAVLAIPRRTWDIIGGISERWFMYAEDIDLCWKIKNSNLRVVLYSDLHANHFVGASDSTGSFSINPAWIVNLLDFYRLRFSKNAYFARVWCLIVSVGLMSRSKAFRIRAVRSSSREADIWSTEATKFHAYATQIFSNSLRLPEFQE